jgi:hypothetical protein
VWEEWEKIIFILTPPTFWGVFLAKFSIFPKKTPPVNRYYVLKKG